MKEKTLKKIIKYWNSGNKEGARRLFSMSQWLFSKNTNDYLNEKLYSARLVNYACKIMNGKVVR